MTVFLRWTLVNVTFLAALIVAGFTYHGDVHVAGKVSVFAVLAVYTLASAHAGVLAFRALPDRAGHLSLAIRACPMGAMLGTITGFLIAFSGTSADVQQRVLGASTGLTATFIGVACALALMLQQHLLGPSDAA